MAPGPEPIQPLGDRLRRGGEMLIGQSGSPIPTYLFRTLAEQAETVVPHDYLAVGLEDAEQPGHLALSGLVRGAGHRARHRRPGPARPGTREPHR